MAIDTPAPTEDDAAIRVRGLNTRFGRTVIHKDLDLDVRRGEILGLVGGSGTGKTVLLREMLLLDQPTSGTVEVLGERGDQLRPDGLRRLRQRTGVLFQQGALFTGMTVRENIVLVICEHACLRQRLANELASLKISLAGLPADAADKYPDALSGGMIKRAALARALALDPELLFLDEPTSGLDPVSAAAFDTRIVELRDLLGFTVVMITHDPESLRQATDRVAFLANQRVHALAPMAEMLTSSDPLVRDYFQGARSRPRDDNDGQNPATGG